MTDKVKDWLIHNGLTSDERAGVDRAVNRLNSAGFDSWGMEPEMLKAVLAVGKWFYRHYFRVEVEGIDRVPTGRALIVGNHSGQFPIDGLLVGTSMWLDAKPPRLVRGMVERWFPSVPFISHILGRCGQVVGNERNCRTLLENDETVMVFPEGAGGIGKDTFHRYELQKFGTGFARLALETKTPIVPVAIIGCEETYISLSKLSKLARLIKAPYVPLLPLPLLFGPMGLLPLPTKVTIRYCEPLLVEGEPDMPDSELLPWIEKVKESIQSEIDTGLQKRGERWFTGSAK